MRSNQVTARDLIRGRLDDRNIVGVEVAHDQLAAIGFECKVYWSLANVEQCQQFVCSQIDRSHLPRSGASDKGFGAIGKNDDVFRLLASRNRAANRYVLSIDDGDSVVSSIADHDSLAIWRYSRQAGRDSDAQIPQHQPFIEIDDGNII